jgi:hypothetical protein
MAELVKISELPEVEDVELDASAEVPAVFNGQTIRTSLRQIGELLTINAQLVAAAPLPANTADGFTLTADANGALSIDGVFAQAGEVVLVAGEADQANNGLYVVTASGGGSAPWVLTRRPTVLRSGMSVSISKGDSFRGSTWQLVWTGNLFEIGDDQNWVLSQIAPRKATFQSTNSGSSLQTISDLNYAIPEGYYVQVHFRAIGMQGSEVGLYGKVATYYRLSGGDAADGWKTTVGKSPDSGSAPFESDASWDADITRSTNSLAFQVKQNGENPGAKWVATVEILAIPLPS